MHVRKGDLPRIRNHLGVVRTDTPYAVKNPEYFANIVSPTFRCKCYNSLRILEIALPDVYGRNRKKTYRLYLKMTSARTPNTGEAEHGKLLLP